MHRLSESLLNYIRKHDLLRAADRVGVAVSGGADSVALIRLMLELRWELGIVPSVVHFNHKLRGEESDADERFVRNLAIQHDVAFIVENGEVKTHAADKKISIETAARELRYAFFHRLFDSGEFNKIATAHTLDDQAETVLLKLGRGAGTRGMAGIYPRKHILPSVAGKTHSTEAAIVRPLLAVRRSEIEQYLHTLKQNWREDSSNRDVRHTRNRVRHEILPRLAKAINPRIHETLAEAAEIARAEEEYWTQQIAILMRRVWKAQKCGGTLDRDTLRAQPSAVQRRLVRAIAESLGLSLDFQDVEQILALDNQGACAALPENLIATVRKSAIHFGPPQSDYAQHYEYRFKVPATIAVREAGLVIEAQLVQTKEHNPEALLASGFSERELTIRNWHPGERFRPVHSKQPRKIKELLQNRHITGKTKKLWPVIACGDEVIWVHGLGIQSDAQTHNGLGIKLHVVAIENNRPAHPQCCPLL